MIQCRHCQSRQLAGTIFCTECGASLLHVRQVQVGSSTTVPTATLPSEPVSAPILALVVQSSGRRISLAVEDELLIGRADDNRGIIPDIDLGRDGGFDAGVSRRHAIISQRQQGIYVEDLSSANGTFINGKQLAPSSPTRVEHGDELKCGALKLRVELR